MTEKQNPVGTAEEGMLLMVSIIASFVTFFITIWYNIPPMIGCSLGFAYCAYGINKMVSDRKVRPKEVKD